MQSPYLIVFVKKNTSPHFIKIAQEYKALVLLALQKRSSYPPQNSVITPTKKVFIILTQKK